MMSSNGSKYPQPEMSPEDLAIKEFYDDLSRLVFMSETWIKLRQTGAHPDAADSILESMGFDVDKCSASWRKLSEVCKVVV